MRALDIARLAFAFMLLSPAVHAAEPAHDIKGLFLMTDYPAVTVRPGTTSNISLRLQNYDLSPQRYQLSVAGVPSGWTATLLGGGQPVAAAVADFLQHGGAMRGQQQAAAAAVVGIGRVAPHQPGRFQRLDVAADGRAAQLFHARQFGHADAGVLADGGQQHPELQAQADRIALRVLPYAAEHAVQGKAQVVRQRGRVLGYRFVAHVDNNR